MEFIRQTIELNILFEVKAVPVRKQQDCKMQPYASETTNCSFTTVSAYE
jgi:hypothetical protein